MIRQTENLEQMDLAVEVGPSLGHFADPSTEDNKVFERLLNEYINDLIEDMMIPVSVSLKARLWTDSGADFPNMICVIINSQTILLSNLFTVEEGITPTKLARFVAANIHRNRDVFISTTVAGNLLKQWSANSTVDVENFRNLLSELVKRNYRVQRAWEVIEGFNGEETDGWGFKHEIEYTIAIAEGIAITLFIPQVRASRLVDIPENEVREVLPSSDEMQFGEMIEMMRDGLFYDLGIILPKVNIETDESLGEADCRVQLNDMRYVPIAGLDENQVLVNDTPDRLQSLNIEGRRAFNPVNRNECAVVNSNDRETCELAGLTTWDAAGYYVLSLARIIRENAGSFLSTEIVNFYLRQLGQTFPSLVQSSRALIQNVTLTRLLRDLLDEEVAIRNLRDILLSLLEVGSSSEFKLEEKITYSDDVLRQLRASLRQYISHKYSRGGNMLVVFLLDHAIETRLLDNKPLSKHENDQLITALFTELSKLPPFGQIPVILTISGIRKRLRNTISKSLPHVSVLCYDELNPDLGRQVLGRISWDLDKEIID